MNDITSFSGEHAFLSNMWMVQVKFDNQVYASTEHAYQAAKTLDFDERIKIQSSPSPYKAKRLGRKVTVRADWDLVKDAVMTHVLRQKFEVPYLRDLLMKTKGRRIVEGNTWHDTYWGECPIGNGQNKLGKILMGIRDDPFTTLL